MKKLLLSLALIVSIGTINAQNIYNYGFSGTTADLTTAGWSLNNQSGLPSTSATAGLWRISNYVSAASVAGITSHYSNNDIPVGTNIPVPNGQAGGANSFCKVNFNSTTDLSATGSTISNWLISPVVNVKNGDVVTFYTRSIRAVTSAWGDSLQLRMSTDGAFTAEPSTGPTDIGSYTTIVANVNPTIGAATYPVTWTKFTYTISGLSVPTDVKFGFRYYVTTAGFNAPKGDDIGIDTFSVDTPEACAPPTALVASLTNPTGSTISWTATATPPANGYEYYYSTTNTDPTVATVAQGTTAAGITTKTLTGLMNNTSYYVWVRSVCSATEKSSWSVTPATFNTTPLPGCVTLTAPLNAATGIALTLVDGAGANVNGYPLGTRFTSSPIAWTAPTSGGAVVGYNIYLGLTASNLPFFGSLSNATATGVNLPGLLYGTTYYWKVLPTNAGGEAVGCTTIFSFTTSVATSCLNNDYAKWPTATYTLVNVNGTANIIATDCFGSEYSEVNVTAGQTYEFSSSVATDYITISKDGGLTSVAFGITPVLHTNTTAGTVRFYTHLNNKCEDINVNRSRIVRAGGALATDTFSSVNFKSFPNPVKDVLNLSYDKNITNVAVINLLGQEVLSSKLNTQEAKIDMSGLAAGAYMVKVTADNEVKTIKVIKE
jgi:Secretion system C-terminal sorting domain